MKNYKRAQAVMLPTTEKTDLFIINKQLFKCHKPQQGDGVDTVNQNLYIISDDKIIEGDWYLVELFKITGESNGLKLEQCEAIDDGWVNNSDVVTARHIKNCKKVIATTDRKLTDDNRTYISGLMGKPNILPQPSQQFIEKYIESYNKGEVITDVLVEYERIPWNLDEYGSLILEEELRLKINPDNTITIKELKETWDRKEVEAKLFELLQDIQHDETLLEHYGGDYREFDKWVEENL
jgi:hypothetical protein